MDTLVTGQPTTVTGWTRIALAPARNIFAIPRRAAAATHHPEKAVGKDGSTFSLLRGAAVATHHPHRAVRNEKGTILREVAAATYHAHSNGKESVQTGRHPAWCHTGAPNDPSPRTFKGGLPVAPRTATNAQELTTATVQ